MTLFPHFRSLLLLSVAATFFALFGVSASRADAPDKNYSGHYELLAVKSDRSFTLDVKQDRDRAHISFAAAMSDGSGAAPDAEGKGEVEDGVLNFKFKDSFNNEGTAVLSFKANAYRLSLTVTKVVDPSPLHFYGAMALKQTRGHPGN